MSKNTINAGDTLTVGDLTDDYLGAEIEVETLVDIAYRFTLGALGDDWHSQRGLWTPKARVGSFYPNALVKVITPPPVVQPEEPTVRGQMFRVEGMPSVYGFRVSPNAYGDKGFWWRSPSCFWRWDSWDQIKECVGERQIIVSDLPCWPDETPVVPERIEEGEWPADDTHLRAWEWIERDGYPWWWNAQLALWESEYLTLDTRHPLFGPWTRGNRVEETDARVARDDS